jgi:hypothetical protein
MTLSPITIGAVVLVMLALTILISFAMARRQQEALKLEHKPIPTQWKIIMAGLITIFCYIAAVAGAILMMVGPFISLQLTDSVDNTTNLLVGVVLGLFALGSALYWIFVKLGLFSWKTFSLDN